MAGLKREVVTLNDQWQLAFPDGLSEADVSSPDVPTKSAAYAADFDETDKATGIASIDLAGRNQVMLRFFGTSGADGDPVYIFGQRKCKEHKGDDGAAQLGGGVDSDWLMTLTMGLGTKAVDESRAGAGVTTAKWADDLAVTGNAVPALPGAELLPASTVTDVTMRVKFDATGYERLTLFLPAGANAQVCGL